MATVSGCSKQESRFLPDDASPPTMRIWTVGSEYHVGEPIEVRGEVVAIRPGEGVKSVAVYMLQKKTAVALRNAIEDPSTDQIHYPFHITLKPVTQAGDYVIEARAFYFLRTPGVEEGDDPGREMLVLSNQLNLNLKKVKK